MDITFVTLFIRSEALCSQCRIAMQLIRTHFSGKNEILDITEHQARWLEETPPGASCPTAIFSFEGGAKEFFVGDKAILQFLSTTKQRAQTS